MSFSRRGLENNITFWQKIYLKFVTNTCSSMLSLEVLYTLSSVVQIASKETVSWVKW